ncbi:hypothetical protein GGTG_11127 [Gaeumannomyces tritici R3-111a-1]|uniref:Uncharacterized protein n=1 Tax=Gaeumannomyces tritici (strain R3-111a-1) TaxID=644352 RepID=J3PCA4_GAET3|nr:hypothetical protein GGTG_11127 [Gaeumannomyces tritici R3-111a-1]EJT71874.1 hypothetical protein GGTG_11127 [Gaeumannomyces tritici R3-111a-1]
MQQQQTATSQPSAWTGSSNRRARKGKQAGWADRVQRPVLGKKAVKRSGPGPLLAAEAGRGTRSALIRHAKQRYVVVVVVVVVVGVQPRLATGNCPRPGAPRLPGASLKLLFAHPFCPFVGRIALSTSKGSGVLFPTHPSRPTPGLEWIVGAEDNQTRHGNGEQFLTRSDSQSVPDASKHRIGGTMRSLAALAVAGWGGPDVFQIDKGDRRFRDP